MFFAADTSPTILYIDGHKVPIDDILEAAVWYKETHTRLGRYKEVGDTQNPSPLSL